MKDRNKRNPYHIAKMLANTDKKSAEDYADMIEYREKISKEAGDIIRS